MDKDKDEDDDDDEKKKKVEMTKKEKFLFSFWTRVHGYKKVETLKKIQLKNERVKFSWAKEEE